MIAPLAKTFRNTGHTTRFIVSREVLLLFSTYLAYSISKNLIDPTPILKAFSNAWSLITLEKQLGLEHEATIQVWASTYSMGFLTFLAYFYSVGLWVALFGSAALLFINNRRVYWSLRNIYMITMLSAVVVFAFYPLAPPRMLPGYGMADIANMLGLIPAAGSRSFFGYNEFAAMPSLHIAWSSLIMLAWFKMGWKWGKIGSMIFFGMMILAVIATANHYVLDAVAGILLFLFGMWLIGLPANLRKMLEDRDLQDLRELMPGWLQPHPEGGGKMGYHRKYAPQAIVIPIGGASSGPLAEAPWQILS
jgi:hypothetical protein